MMLKNILFEIGCYMYTNIFLFLEIVYFGKKICSAPKITA